MKARNGKSPFFYIFIMSVMSYSCLNSAFAKPYRFQKSLIYNGWYVQTHDDGNGQLTARLYGEYLVGKNFDKGVNVASYRCEKHQAPFLRVVLPDNLLSSIKSAKHENQFHFTDYVWFKSRTKLIKFIAWYSAEVNGFTIPFNGGNNPNIQYKRHILISMMSGNFTIHLPIKHLPRIKFMYAPQAYANSEVGDLGRIFGREFVLQRKLEFLTDCE